MTPVSDQTILELRALERSSPQLATDRIEQLIATMSIRELVQMLNATFAEVTASLGIDWSFTVTQWKIGNCGCEEFLETFPEARLKVWSLPFHAGNGDIGNTRFTTCLPFQFKPAWEAHRSIREDVCPKPE